MYCPPDALYSWDCAAGMARGWDVAYAALYLHSDEAGFVTGVSLAVDGGEGVRWGS